MMPLRRCWRFVEPVGDPSTRVETSTPAPTHGRMTHCMARHQRPPTLPPPRRRTQQTRPLHPSCGDQLETADQPRPRTRRHHLEPRTKRLNQKDSGGSGADNRGTTPTGQTLLARPDHTPTPALRSSHAPNPPPARHQPCDLKESRLISSLRSSHLVVPAMHGVKEHGRKK